MTGHTPTRPVPRLHGRDAHLRAVQAFLDRPATADGASLVISGEPGLGRTALLDHAARSFTAGPVLHLRTDPAHTRLPHGGVRALVRAAGAPDDRPPDGTRTAAAGPGCLPDLFRGVCGGLPLLVCVDDAHLWDPPSRAALRRAVHDPHPGVRVGLLLSVAADRALAPDFAGLPVTSLDPLGPGDLAALLDDSTGPGTEPAVRERLVEAAAGNPALLLALVRRLTPAQLRGERELPRPLPGPGPLSDVAGAVLAGLPPYAADLVLAVSAALRASDDTAVDTGPVLRAAARLHPSAPAPGRRSAPAPLAPVDGRFAFHSALVRETAYATAAPERRRAVHRALAEELAPADGTAPGLTALLHRSWATAGPAPRGLPAELAATAADPAVPASYRLRSVALDRAAELTVHPAAAAERRTAAAAHALTAGQARRALRLVETVLDRAPTPAVRGRAELVRGTALLRDGSADDAHASLLCAASLLRPHAPAEAAAAALSAADAAWAAGDLPACLAALADGAPRPGAGPGPAPRTAGEGAGPKPLDDYRRGMSAVLEARFDDAAEPLRRLVERARPGGRPEELVRSTAAALLLGDVAAARRAGARALAGARTLGSAALVPPALEYLAYAELRAGRHAQARAHAEEGLRAARRAGQRNTAAHHHAALALAASIEGEPAVVAAHVRAALETALRHGLVQAATLAHWAAARADLGRGRPVEAADRLGPLVRPGPRRGHFAVWMLAVPCFTEAAVLAGRPAQAADGVLDFARWAACGADPHAPAQLARCRALLAGDDRADTLYRRALALHEEAGGDFERARTQLLYGKWLRRRRRLRAARDQLGAALVGFEGCGARVWAEQAHGELRAHGTAPGGRRTGALSRLTPQQLRIARCVADGATNREVALVLSVSTRTVDYHLRNVFAALGVRSRVELARMVEQAERGAAHP
ncbi:LuxR family transcriptional regulator [Streptomyces sp. TG1A-8]|uniref:helix-turn-helix transcriptional regulator n=1 Tax=Streptomyces sp. TG1A-8 TaxID=3051385 RepID=UPI00265C8631|nr:LuxR family transcriptional regulator [Streptomyces sp. TG1A-8]MDO0929294.1 LuxR family transcriptional regulator [Streptomyces sp. TG1A-8]